MFLAPEVTRDLQVMPHSVVCDTTQPLVSTRWLASCVASFKTGGCESGQVGCQDLSLVCVTKDTVKKTRGY